MRSVAQNRQTRRLDRLDRTHRIAFDARHLHQSPDRIASQPEIMLHTDLGGILHLQRRAAPGGGQARSSHRTGDADFTLTAHFRSGNGSIFLEQRSNRGGGQQKNLDASRVRSRRKPFIKTQHRRYDPGSAVGRCRDHLATRSIFLIHRQSPEIDPVQYGQRVGQGPLLPLHQPRVDQRRTAFDAQATGQYPALLNSAIDTVRHRIGNRTDAGADRFVFLPGTLVGAHDVGDRQPFVGGDPEQVRARTKAIGHIPQAAFRIVAANLVLIQNRTAADRIIDAGRDRLLIPKSGKPHGIAVKIEPLFLVKDQVRRFIISDCMAPVQPDLHRFPNLRHQHIRRIGFDMLWSFAAEPEQDRPIRCVPLAGQRQRTEQPCFQPGNSVQLTAIGNPLDKLRSRQHRTHGVRTGRSDADLEKLEGAADHIARCPSQSPGAGRVRLLNPGLYQADRVQDSSCDGPRSNIIQSASPSNREITFCRHRTARRRMSDSRNF